MKAEDCKFNELKESLEFHEDKIKYCKTQKEIDIHREKISELMCEIATLEQKDKTAL